MVCVNVLYFVCVCECVCVAAAVVVVAPGRGRKNERIFLKDYIRIMCPAGKVNRQKRGRC